MVGKVGWIPPGIDLHRASPARVYDSVAGTGILEADMCDVDSVLGSPLTRKLVDFDEPVAVIIASALHYVLEAELAAHVVARYLDAVVPGSFLVLSHISDGSGSPEIEGLVDLSRATTNEGVARSREWLMGLLSGLDVVEPGLVYTSEWRPDGQLGIVEDLPEHASLLAAVARKT